MLLDYVDIEEDIAYSLKLDLKKSTNNQDTPEVEESVTQVTKDQWINAFNNITSYTLNIKDDDDDVNYDYATLNYININNVIINLPQV